MNYKRFLIEPSPNYAAKIFRCPQMIDDFNFTLHWHRDYEFIYVKKGPLKVQKIECQIVLNDGDVYFMNSEEIHSYCDVTDDLQFVVVNISPKILKPYFENSDEIPTFEIKKGNACDKIAHSLKALYECENLNDRLEILKIKAIINNISYNLIKYYKNPNISFVKGSDSDDFDCAKSAIKYMEENYASDISLTEIANYVGMTPAHFSKYFKDKNEMTFLKYLRRIRLDHAIKDLRDSEISVKDAALKNGFPNVNSLILTCKEIYGRTPLEMKQFVRT